VQLLYAPDKAFSALFNVHGRSLDGTARLFRANIIKPGTHEFVDSFNERQISIDGRNEQTLDGGGASVRLKWDWGNLVLNSITGYEKVKAYSRGDIDGGFGAVFAPPMGPGFIPFPVGIGRRAAEAQADHAGVPPRIAQPRIPRLAGRGIFLQGRHHDRQLQLRHAGWRRGERLRETDPGQQGRGAVRVHQPEALPGAGPCVRGLRYTHDQKDFTAQRFQSPIGGRRHRRTHRQPQ
jgi:iron complex outermembrane receptor protein